MSSSSSKEDIEAAGRKALFVLYGSTSENLNPARVDKFQLVATSSGIVPPEKLPSTVDAAALHSLRV